MKRQLSRWRVAGVLIAVLLAVIVVHATDRTDNFTGTNGSPLSASWTVDTVTIVINSNAAFATASAGVAYWNADSFSNDQYSQLVNVEGYSYVNPAVRIAGSAGALNGYVWYPQFGFYRLDAGTATNIDSTTTTVAAGDTFKITVTGTTLEAFKNGVSIGTKVDATYTSGAPGFYISSANNVHADDWLGGPISGGGGATSHPCGSLRLLGVGCEAQW